MAEILSTVSLVSYIVSGICFVLAVFFWFKFNILSVIGDLSGATAKKSIARMRANNEKSGSKTFRPSASNVERGRLTDTMKMTNKLGKGKKQTGEIGSEETDLLTAGNQSNYDTEQTALLEGTEETSLLSNEGATELLADEGATELLVDQETGPLADTRTYKALTMIESIMFIHTDEVIE